MQTHETAHPRVQTTRVIPRHLANQKDINALKEKLANDPRPRITLSFYRYVMIDDPDLLRDQLYQEWDALDVLGRVYVAQEGINAQISVPEENRKAFFEHADSVFPQIIIKEAVENADESFYKLVIKAKKKILADGMNDETYDVTNVGRHLNAQEFNQAMELEDTIVVDVRNHYESEVGHFQDALLPDVDTFRDELPLIKDMLEGKEERKILLYCTGGIRCEKASAWLKHNGFQDVNQLHGGIISYAKQTAEQKLDNKFIGKNFVFDNRLGERITDDVIASCHVCEAPADDHTNCRWQGCHILLIMCDVCREKFSGCCSQDCLEKTLLPEDVQKKLRQAALNPPPRFSKGRKRPSIPSGGT